MILFIPIFICVYLCIKMLHSIEKLYRAISPLSIKRKICKATYIIIGLPISVYPLTVVPDIMIFDSPGSSGNPMAWLIFIALVFYPLALMSIMWWITKMLAKK